MKTNLIIGASTGIGQALANSLAEKGETVIGTFHKTVTSNRANVSYHSLNVLDSTLDFNFLPDTIDSLVYCPGRINLKPFARLKPDSFTDDFNLQVLGAIKVIQAVLPRLKKSESGSILLFSTVAVQMGYNFHSQVAVSKGAIEGLTRALAAELAPKIRVNAIAPSLTQTPLAERLLSSDEKIAANDQRHPLKRIGQPEDLAEMAAFLVSNKASWVTGQILHVDGGMSAIK